jgi:hypothetical protein
MRDLEFRLHKVDLDFDPFDGNGLAIISKTIAIERIAQS